MNFCAIQDTVEGWLLSYSGDSDCPGLLESCIRVGVRDLTKSKEWYQEYLILEVGSDHVSDGYIVIQMKVNHYPTQLYNLVLEYLPEDAFVVKWMGRFIHSSSSTSRKKICLSLFPHRIRIESYRDR
jgi:hypothetical protein